MKAYIKVEATGKVVNGNPYFMAEVVSEQDYYECGPFAHSHRTEPFLSEQGARNAAMQWASKNGYTIVNVEEI